MTHLKIIIFCEIFVIYRVISLACGPNEIEMSCPAACEADYCPKQEEQALSCPQPVPCPEPVCKCRFDYRRADNGTCIPTEQCPPFDCSRPNEEHTPCPPLCPDDCAHATRDGDCPPTFGFVGMVVPCSPQCRCRKHHWRRNGTCVPFEEC